jgi:hypothetical protein
MGSVRTSIIRETSTPTQPPTHSPDYTLVREEPLLPRQTSVVAHADQLTPPASGCGRMSETELVRGLLF